jgi:peptide methionine sulfoxide reductase msrA/msrB
MLWVTRPVAARTTIMTLRLLALLALGCASSDVRPAPATAPQPPGTEVAYLAGGCFWGMEELLRKTPGVIDTEVGFVNGAETVRVVFDPARLPYADLLEKHFFRIHDPTTRNRQGNDVGPEYRSAIFTTSEAQARVAREAIANSARARRWPRPRTTEVAPAGPYSRASEAHQDYLQKHPDGYTCHYVREWI